MNLNSSSMSTESSSRITMSQKCLRHGAVLTLVVLFLNGCASYQIPARAAYHPSKLMPQQDADRAECIAFAKARTGYDPVTAAAQGGVIAGLIGAITGAATGAAVGAVSGGAGSGAAALGAIGGGIGALWGGSVEMQRMHKLFTSEYSVCMHAKGYTLENPSEHWVRKVSY